MKTNPKDLLLRRIAEDCYRSFMGREIVSRIPAYEPDAVSRERRESEDRLRSMMGEELFDQVEDELSEHEFNIEKEFFSYGFRYALALMDDREALKA
ncbi:MAG: hypothetical protein IJT16_15405 [Lachnospiraceae bacterium]|nr:hypothetical protein [Lachnospiraceae bacterium]